jgi:S1-C subfamily serine protease
MSRRLLIGCVVMCTLLSLPLLAVEKERERMILTIKPGVVLVYCDIKVKVALQTQEGLREFEPIDMSGAGSGFIVNPDGYIVTNGHVVKEYHSKENNLLKQNALLAILQKYIFPALEQQKGAPLTREDMIAIFQKVAPYTQFQILKQLYVILSNWQSFPAEIKQYSPPITPIAGKSEGIISYEEEESGKDIAILKIEQTNLPTVQLGDSSHVSLQDAVFPAGYPGVVTQHNYLSQASMLEASITSGNVSSLKLDVKGTPVIQFDAPVTWGNSGGPVFNEKGEVIGIATFISLAPMGGQSAIPIQGFNFAVPINTAKEFISAAGIQPKSGLFNTMWAEALDFYFNEDYEDVLSKCDEILRLMPNQPDAKRIQVKSQEQQTANPQNPVVKFGRKNWIWLVAVLGLGLVAVVVVIAALAGRKKSAAPAARPGPAAPEMKATVVDVHSDRRQVGSFGRIVCEKGPQLGKNYEIPAAGLVFGRDPAQASVVVPDDHVSKVHAVLTPSPKGLLLEDRGSTNGTFVNQVGPQGIQQTYLKAGDRIILGSKQAAIFRVE